MSALGVAAGGAPGCAGVGSVRTLLMPPMRSKLRKN
jgi:hypothetical protein